MRRPTVVRVLGLAALGGLATAASAQISPGDLAKVHAAIDGASGCLRCHAPGKGVDADRCLSCHTAIKARVTTGRGLHARPEYRKCETCHIDHQGRDVDLRWWGPKGVAGFNHADTGYVLEGRHAAVECARCHNSERVLDPAALARGGGSAARTYLGLGTTCVSCHRDIHRGQFGKKDCAACHTLDTFKRAARFDHAQTKYPLTGRHANVACDKCHAPAGAGAQTHRVYAGVAFASCTNCHTDTHRGRLGSACASCHATGGWTSILKTSNFDHSKTAYPLVGGHRAVACNKCHKGALTVKMKHDRCSDCHTDSHRGEFKARAEGGACESCHDVASFTATRFSVDEHQKSAYRLEGSHRAVPCAQCHRRAPNQKTAAYRMPHDRCLNCHTDSHRGEFKTRAEGGACESCHDATGFSDARFSMEDHQKSAYPLEGAHRAVPCDKCHRRTPGQKTATYRVAHDRCLDCHADPHRGTMDRYAGPKGCVACHNADSWRAAAFDHSATRFPLTLGHAGLTCASCHTSLKARRPGDLLNFAGLSTTCASCHRDVHAGQFAREGQTACQRCHAGAAWKPAPGFDHGRDTAYRLDGRHARVPCASCHKAETRDGVTTTKYKPLGTACADCHTGRKS